MTIRNTAIKIAIGTVFASSSVLAPIGAFAVTSGVTSSDPDPAHHSTNLSDPDPAHHRPFVFCSASTSDCTTVPVVGFDIFGNPLGGRPAPSADTDPAHHSTDLNDADPTHHQPIVVDGRLVALRGFDLNGFKLHSDFFA